MHVGADAKFIHIDDVVAVNLWLLDNPCGGILNCFSSPF